MFNFRVLSCYIKASLQQLYTFWTNNSSIKLFSLSHVHSSRSTRRIIPITPTGLSSIIQHESHRHCLVHLLEAECNYSPVPNNSTGTFIFFHQKGPPVRAYSGAIFILFSWFGTPVLLLWPVLLFPKVQSLHISTIILLCTTIYTHYYTSNPSVPINCKVKMLLFH